MFKHTLKDIYVGKNSGQLLDPSDIEFSFYSYGRHLDEDGEIAKYPSFNLVTTHMMNVLIIMLLYKIYHNLRILI